MTKRLFLLPIFFSSIGTLSALETTNALPELMSEWKQAGPGSFEVKENIATAKGGMGLWWFGKQEYSNACLEIEFLMPELADNSGVFVRFPNPGNDPWVAVRKGYEIQISGNKANKKNTGGIYDIKAPIASEVKVGEWNTYKILTVGNQIGIILNDRLINIFECQKGRGDEKGYFGLQNHDNGSPVQFRNVKVHELKSTSLLHAFDELKVPRSSLVSYYASATPKERWFHKADHGPAFTQTFADWSHGRLKPDSNLKSIALSYSALPKHIALFNTETLSLSTATSDGYNLINTPWGGGHGRQNQINNRNNFLFRAPDGPGWADTKNTFDDTRPIKGHGNFSNLKFNGYFRNGHRIILDYAVNGTRILESVTDHKDGLVRYLEIAPHQKPLTVRLASASSSKKFGIGFTVDGKGATMNKDGETTVLEIHPTPEKTSYISILYSSDGNGNPPRPIQLTPLTKGGPGLSPQSFSVETQIDSSDKPWLVDRIPLPPAGQKSPYLSKVRLSDIDFFSDGKRALISTWDGDIWLLSGLDEFKTLTWKRYATGFFEPLGLKIVNDIPHIAARDGIYQTFDLNGDNEADHFKLFNNDVYLTNNFHEFQFGLETDTQGNFYFAKGCPVRAGGRGFDKILPHNGAFVRISPDGSKLETIATGLRAPGGIGVGPNGEITTGENEGTWQPRCKINYHEPKNGTAFFGVEDARNGNKTPFTEPLCYLPMSVDNSGGSQIWVTDQAKIGIPTNELLHLSYGQSAIYHVLRQEVSDGFYQGGVVKLPIKLASSAQRAVFHNDGSMFVLGLRGWQTNAAQEAGLQRIRFNEKKPSPLPQAMEVTKEGIKLTFAVELDDELATDPASFSAQRWKYIRGPQYGSGDFSVDTPDLEAEKLALTKESKKHRKRDTVKIAGAKLLDDKKTIQLTIDGHKPSQQFKLEYDLESIDGDEVIGVIHSTIHKIPGK